MLAGALALAAAILVQAVLGILTLVHQVPLALALAHQAMAILVLTIAVVHAQRLERRQVADGTEPAVLASSPRLDARGAATQREGAT